MHDNKLTMHSLGTQLGISCCARQQSMLLLLCYYAKLLDFSYFQGIQHWCANHRRLSGSRQLWALQRLQGRSRRDLQGGIQDVPGHHASGEQLESSWRWVLPLAGEQPAHWLCGAPRGSWRPEFLQHPVWCAEGIIGDGRSMCYGDEQALDELAVCLGLLKCIFLPVVQMLVKVSVQNWFVLEWWQCLLRFIVLWDFIYNIYIWSSGACRNNGFSWKTLSGW